MTNDADLLSVQQAAAPTGIPEAGTPPEGLPACAEDAINQATESTTAAPIKSPSPTMARARAAVHSDRVADAERGRARTASLPSLDELELTAEQIAEETVTVSQAAELTGVSVQAIDQLIVRGSLVAYRDAKGRRVVTVDDLVDSRPARRQANRLAEERHRLAWLQAHLDDGLCEGAACEQWTHVEPMADRDADR